jgi:hypothetical protein
MNTTPKEATEAERAALMAAFKTKYAGLLAEYSFVTPDSLTAYDPFVAGWRARAALATQPAAPAEIHGRVLQQAIRDAQAEPPKPVAWARKWHIDGEAEYKSMGQSGRMKLDNKFKFLPVTKGKCLADDVPLYAEPVPAASEPEP